MLCCPCRSCVELPLPHARMRRAQSDHIPFDPQHRKYQLYKNDKEGLMELRTAVARRLKTLIKNAK
jgi:hypothetical protein